MQPLQIVPVNEVRDTAIDDFSESLGIGIGSVALTTEVVDVGVDGLETGLSRYGMRLKCMTKTAEVLEDRSEVIGNITTVITTAKVIQFGMRRS